MRSLVRFALLAVILMGMSVFVAPAEAKRSAAPLRQAADFDCFVGGGSGASFGTVRVSNTQDTVEVTIKLKHALPKTTYYVLSLQSSISPPDCSGIQGQQVTTNKGGNATLRFDMPRIPGATLLVVEVSDDPSLSNPAAHNLGTPSIALD